MSVTAMQCDECGREMAVAHRVYKDHRYCATCYARVFKRRMCPKCRNYVRLPKNDENAICSKCGIDKPCIRCDKTEYAVGKITPYGPVCSSCASYFREVRPCEICGKSSHRLTRVKRLGIDVPVCPKCARSDHGTCSACHRPRLLQDGPGGKLLCKACLEQGEIPCAVCNKPMPAGRGNLCDACYWQNAFRKRLKLDQESFSIPEMKKVFGAFGGWLLTEVGGQKAALSVHRYLPFFVEIEKQWGSIPGYANLLANFEAEGLHRVRLPMRWLNETKNIVPDVSAREQNSAQRQIAAILASFPIGTLASKLLMDYQGRLLKRVNAGKSTLRSVRLALRPAASLLLAADKNGSLMPDQAALEHYLLEASGQKAAVTGFVNFLKEKHGLGLVLKVNEKQVREARRKKLGAEMMLLVREGGEGEDFRRRWISVALTYFHGLPRKVGRIVQSEQISAHEDRSLTITWGAQKYWIPEGVRNFV